MTLLTTGRLFWHCGAHTAEPKIDDMSPIPPIPYYQKLLFSVAEAASVALSVACTRTTSTGSRRGSGEAREASAFERQARRPARSR